MKTTLKFLLITAAVALASCTGSTSEQQNETGASQSATNSPEATGYDHHSIALNDGKKWKVDDAMLIHIRQMEARVNSSTESDTLAPVAQYLQLQIDSLTSACTMKGQAHDELHKWLVPFIGQVGEFASADPAEQKTMLSGLKSTFTEFNRYFE